MFFLFALMFYLEKKEQVKLAGIVLAIIAIRPDMFLVACGASLILLWNARHRIKGLVLSAGLSLIIINLTTIFLLGLWYSEWLKILVYYSANNPFAHWPLEHLPNLVTRVAFLLALFGYLIWPVFQFVKNPIVREKLLAISALIIIYQLLVKMIGSYYMTILLIPALILLHLYSRYKLQWVAWTMFFLPWVLWVIYVRSQPWLPQLLAPTSLLMLQILFIWTSKKQNTTNIAIGI